ncbi:MAG: histidine kinase [Balneolales bacterium]|nr:histidine kinase [Balneolales bacterium]
MFKELKPSEIFLPILLTGLFPLLALVSGNEEWQQLSGAEQVTRWIILSSFLMVIWFSNLFIKKRSSRVRYWIKVIGLNTILVVSFSVITTYSLSSLATPAEMAGSSFFRFIRPGIAAGLILIFQFTLRASKDNARLKNENLALQAEYYKAELEQLRKQVNPHFLFNSLSTLRTMIRDQKSQEKAEQFVLSLSDVYRQILQTRESDSISLKEELEFLSSYLYLLQIRFGDSISVEIDTLESSEQFSLPSFGLQLLVENCIKHNVASIDEPLSIRIFQKTEESIIVSNNYNPKRTPSESLGTGLTNLSKRYELIGIDNGVSIDQDDTTYSVTLKLF